MKTFYEIDSCAQSTGILPARLCLPSQHVSWKIGTEAYNLQFSTDTTNTLKSLGDLCEKYYQSVESLYQENDEFRGRINSYRAKDFILNTEFASTVDSKHIFYRPDLVLSKDGHFKIAEIDALPGELGVHCFLRDAYGLSSNNIASAILNLMKNLGLTNQIDFIIDSIASEDEYIAEYIYLARKLKKVGITLTIYNIDDYQGPEKTKTLVYRFFDMVHNNQDQIRGILQRTKDTQSVLYPALKHYVEEKLSLSYVHRSDVESIFLRFFEPEELELFRNLLPKVHFLDKQNNSISPGIQLDGKLITSFEEFVSHARRLPYVLKTSAFSDHNSTSKGAKLLENLSKNEITDLFEEHIYKFKEHFILQEKIEPLQIETTVTNSMNALTKISGFSRITPFYFLQNGKYVYTSAHIVIREGNFDVHFAHDATVIPVS